MVHYNLLMKAFLALFISRSLARVYLNELNLSYLHRHRSRIPDEFRDTVDQGKFETILNYTLDSDRFGLWTTLMGEGIFLALLLLGFFPWLGQRIERWQWTPTLSGLAFFGILSLLMTLLRIPPDLYETFVIEGRYGFNTLTIKTWAVDLAKGLCLFTLLGGALLWLLLSLVNHGGKAWWFWAWVFAGGFELLLLWLFPVAIAPFFNKFEPIEDPALEDRIRSLMARVGLQVKGVFKMDASKRSKHTNAFFTGIGRTKRIVLFDTLLQSHPQEEVLGIVGHEAGHWKRRHILKEIVFAETLSLLLFCGASYLLDWRVLYQTFGFQEAGAYVGLFLVGTLLSPLGYFTQPAAAAISRKFEREADDYSLKLMKTPGPLCNALRRLAADNLENLDPHPFYAWFYFSHPPLAERIRRLGCVHGHG